MQIGFGAIKGQEGARDWSGVGGIRARAKVQEEEVVSHSKDTNNFCLNPKSFHPVRYCHASLARRERPGQLMCGRVRLAAPNLAFPHLHMSSTYSELR